MYRQRISVALIVIFALVTGAAVLLGAAGAINYSVESHEARARLSADLGTLADQLSAGLALPVWNFDQPQIDKIIDGAMRGREIYGVVVRLNDVSAPGGVSIRAKVRDKGWRTTAANHEVSAGGLDLLEEQRPLADSTGRQLGTVMVYATPRFMEAGLRTDLIWEAATTISLGIVLVAGLYAMLWLTVLRPLRIVEQNALAVSSGAKLRGKGQSRFFGELASLRSSIEKTIDLLDTRVRERTAELAAANARLRELDRLKSEFLATMSHELRTPLNSIIGFTGIMRQGVAGPINEEQKKQLGLVYGSAKHLLSLITDLLDLSRIEAGKVDLDRQPFNFVDVVREVKENLQPMVGQKGLELGVDLPEGAIPMVGDRKRCFQVLLNLANNAVKFTERGGVRISAKITGGQLEACVTDTGIGIKPQQMGMLFEAFRQLDGSAKRMYEGTGLGLHLCRKLLTLMGGHITAQSEYGKGSRFIFTVPLHLEPHGKTAGN